MTDWRLLHERGSFFAPRDYAGVPTVVFCRVDEPLLVLGSTQAAVPYRGVEVVRRRSGGGAVLVSPESVVWVDVFVPAGHELWEEDVRRAFWWLGDAWAGALAALGVAGVAGGVNVHRGPLVTTAWSSLVCFAGLGPGEVTVDGRKVVGMAQRRTREGALFQCALALTWEPERLAQLLALGADAVAQLADVVGPVGPQRADDAMVALLDHLP